MNMDKDMTTYSLLIYKASLVEISNLIA